MRYEWLGGTAIINLFRNWTWSENWEAWNDLRTESNELWSTYFSVHRNTPSKTHLLKEHLLLCFSVLLSWIQCLAQDAWLVCKIWWLKQNIIKSPVKTVILWYIWIEKHIVFVFLTTRQCLSYSLTSYTHHGVFVLLNELYSPKPSKIGSELF